MEQEKFPVHQEGERLARTATDSGMVVKEFYGPEDLVAIDYYRDIADPGEYPFTRGAHRVIYRGRLWTRRNQTGFGTPRDTKQRIKYLFRQGQTVKLAVDVIGFCA